MSGSRYSIRPGLRIGLAPALKRWALVAAALALALATSGCFYGAERARAAAQSDSPYRSNSTPGTRILVYDGHDEPLLKIRERHRRTKVYGPTMVPVGQVIFDDDEFIVRQRSGARQKITTDNAGAALPGRWKLRSESQGRWSIVDGDDQAVALLHRRDDDSWRLQPNDPNQPILTVDADRDPPAVVDAQSHPLLTVPRRAWHPVKLLILSLDHFPPLDRYSLAAYAAHRLAAPTGSGDDDGR